ncbi:MAG: hypothetical protein QXD48_02195 [Candidatus Aenigmatarchaeota archaeon]
MSKYVLRFINKDDAKIFFTLPYIKDFFSENKIENKYEEIMSYLDNIKGVNWFCISFSIDGNVNDRNYLCILTDNFNIKIMKKNEIKEFIKNHYLKFKIQRFFGRDENKFYDFYKDFKNGWKFNIYQEPFDSDYIFDFEIPKQNFK